MPTPTPSIRVAIRLTKGIRKLGTQVVNSYTGRVQKKIRSRTRIEEIISLDS